MSGRPSRGGRLRLLIFALVLLLAGATAAGAQSAKSVAVALSVKGNAEFSRGDEWKPLAMGTLLDDGDKVRTGEDGFCALVFTDDKSQIKLRPNTNVQLNADRNPDYSLAKRVNMEIGELFAEVKKQKGSLQIATPTAVASVKGTELWVIVNPDGSTQQITLEGLVELLSLTTGETVDVPAGSQGTVGGEGGIDLSDISEEDVPQYLDEMQIDEIEIRFIDEQGNEKTLIIQYRIEEE
ncbi:MAG: hypothetical protein MAG453_01507 [Calditrichaeota bacterium]|nr:hypothetical protein [Calditrichota bacterium]